MIVLQKMKSLFDAPTTAVDPKEKTNETRLMNNAARFMVFLNKVLYMEAYGVQYNTCCVDPKPRLGNGPRARCISLCTI